MVVQLNPCTGQVPWPHGGISAAHGKGQSAGGWGDVSRETKPRKPLSFFTRARMNNQIRNPENATTPNARLNHRRRIYPAHVSAARAKTARGWLHSQARHVRICQSARGEKTGFRYSNARPFHPSEALPYKKHKSRTETKSRINLNIKPQPQSTKETG